MEKGKSFGPFDTYPSDKKLVEKMCINEEEVKNFWEEYRKEEAIGFNNWYADLRKEYSEVSDEIFELCYSKAYDEGHSSGYDEVANIIDDEVEFAKKILKTVKEK
jgi:hypothetical protein